MSNSHKSSVKRTAILNALKESHEHPSAEDLYLILKPVYPDISLGTIYRNLALFCKEGCAVSVATVAGKERFDGRLDVHAHFICRSCGKIQDLDEQNVHKSYQELEDLYHITVEKHSLVYTGVCSSCQNVNA